MGVFCAGEAGVGVGVGGWMEGKLLAPRRVVKVEKIEAMWPRLSEGELVEELELLLAELRLGRSQPRLAISKAWQWGGSERVAVLLY